MMLRILAAVLLMSITTAQAARIDEGALPDIGRFLQGCWVNTTDTIDEQIAANGTVLTVTICFRWERLVYTEAVTGSELGIEGLAQTGTYRIRDDKLVMVGPAADGWVFGRTNVICDVGVKPRVRLGLFDCVGSGGEEPVEFLEDMLLLAKPRTAT